MCLITFLWLLLFECVGTDCKSTPAWESLSTYSGSPYSAGCQTGGNCKGSHKDYKVFAQYLPGFNGTYYLRGKQQQKQSHYYVPFIDGIQGIISNKR